MAGQIAAIRTHRVKRTETQLRRGRLLLRLVALVVGTFALKSFVIDPLTGHFSGEFEDFSAYLGAARYMAHGGSPYAGFDPATVVFSGFDYPPFAAILVRPLALLTDHQAALTWLALSVACALAGSLILAGTALPRTWPRTELAILAAFAFAPTTYNFWHGQINAVIFLLLVLAFRAYTRDRQVQTGVLLGLAAGIKLAPIVLLVLLVRRGWWRGAAAMVTTAAATVVTAIAVLGPEVTRAFLSTILPALNRGTGWIYNQTLGGSVNRLFGHSVLHPNSPSPWIEGLSVASALAVLGVMAWSTRAGSRSQAERGAEFGMGVTAMLLAGSIAWFPHFIHLLIPLFAAVGLAASRGFRPERQLLKTAGSALAVFGLLAPAVIALLSIEWIGALSQQPAWWPFLQLCSIPCFATVLLLIQLARSCRRAIQTWLPA